MCIHSINTLATDRARQASGCPGGFDSPAPHPYYLLLSMKSPLHPVRAFIARFGSMHVILPVSVLNSAGYTIIALGLIFYLRDRFGASAATVGLASALYNGLYFAGCFAWRPLGLRLLPRYSLIISSFTTVVLMVLLVMANRIAVVLALYAAIGFSVALFWPSIMGWLSAGLDGTGLSRRISYFNLAWSAGVIVGPLIAGVLAERRLEWPLIVGTVLVAAVGCIVTAASLFLSGVRTDMHRDRRKSSADGPDESSPLRFPSWIGLVPAYAVLGALLVVVPLHTRDSLGLTESAVGSVLLLRGLTASLGFWAFGRWSGWHFRIGPVVGALALLVPLVLLLRAGALASYLVALPLIGLTVSATYTFSVFHGVAGSSDRTRRMAVHEALLTVGIVIGALGAGRLYETGGASAAYLGSVATLLLGLFLQLAYLVASRGLARRARSSSAGQAAV